MENVFDPSTAAASNPWFLLLVLSDLLMKG
jgi:hypothetical protein